MPILRYAATLMVRICGHIPVQLRRGGRREGGEGGRGVLNDVGTLPTPPLLPSPVLVYKQTSVDKHALVGKHALGLQASLPESLKISNGEPDIWTI